MLLLMMAASVNAQKHEFGNWKRYAQANRELGAPNKKAKRVVLMGNSITDGWPRVSPQFFKDHPYIIGRGIGGQTSYQFLLRFREDVINLQPKVVVINYGTNDVAENTGPYDEDLTLAMFARWSSWLNITSARLFWQVVCLQAVSYGVQR